MAFTDRSLCKLLQKSHERKPLVNCIPWELALISASGQKCDGTDKKYLEPLLDKVGEYDAHHKN